MKKSSAHTLICLAILALIISGCTGVGQAPQSTPIPTLSPATMPAPAGAGKLALLNRQDNCTVYAVELIGAWVKAGYPETAPFEFVDARGKPCSGTFSEDVVFLFNEPNVWYPGGVACTTCHGPNLNQAYARLNLGDYAGIIAGSRRPNAEAKGNDILAGGDWEASRLYQVFATKWMPSGRPPELSEKGPLLFAGKPQ